METLIFVLGILCGAVLLGIAYVIKELLRVKDEIKTLKKNKYVQEDRFSGIEDEIRKISDRIEISTAKLHEEVKERHSHCLLYTSPSPRDRQKSRMPSSA